MTSRPDRLEQQTAHSSLRSTSSHQTWLALAPLLILAAAMAGLWSCGSKKDSSRANVFFSLHFSGVHGFLYAVRNSGLLLRENGELRAYNSLPQAHPEPRPPPPQTLSKTELVEYFGHLESPATQVAPQTMMVLISLVEEAALGKQVCTYAPFEISGTTYLAWRTDANGTSSPVLLGSPNCRNESPAASILNAWLYQILSASKMQSEPAAPSCIPTHVGLLAPESGRVAPNSILVMAGGLRYATLRGQRCLGNDSCECNGDDVCAGGRAHCRELGTEGLACVP